MADGFQCSLVTPEKSVFDAAVTYANLPAHDGQMGIQTGHAPLLVQLGEGRLDLTLPGGSHKRFDLSGGFAQMNANKLVLLSEKAVDLDAPVEQ